MHVRVGTCIVSTPRTARRRCAAAPPLCADLLSNSALMNRYRAAPRAGSASQPWSRDACAAVEMFTRRCMPMRRREWQSGWKVRGHAGTACRLNALLCSSCSGRVHQCVDGVGTLSCRRRLHAKDRQLCSRLCNNFAPPSDRQSRPFSLFVSQMPTCMESILSGSSVHPTCAAHTTAPTAQPTRPGCTRQLARAA